MLIIVRLQDDFVAAGRDETDEGQEGTSSFVQRVKASMNGVVKTSEMGNFRRVCYRLYNGHSGTNLKHMCVRRAGHRHWHACVHEDGNRTQASRPQV